MASSVHSVKEKVAQEENDNHLQHNAGDSDAEFGGTEARRILEKRLLWRIDLRLSIMVVIYILNYACVYPFIPLILSCLIPAIVD